MLCFPSLNLDQSCLWLAQLLSIAGIKNISPGGHHTLSSDRHCPAPGGPGDISVNKSSSEGGFCTPVTCNDGSGGSSSTYSSNGMHNLASETNIACSQEEPLHKESYNGDKKILSQFKEEKISQSVMIQQQRCEEEEENGVNMNSTTGTVQAVSHTLTNVFPAIKSQPPAIVPFTVLDSAKTSRTVDVAGAWNLSKTVNFTYQTMYIPYIRPHTVLYPHYGGYITTSHRPLAFHQERPRYYSTSMVPQVGTILLNKFWIFPDTWELGSFNSWVYFKKLALPYRWRTRALTTRLTCFSI